MWGDLNTQLGFSYGILNDSYAAGCAALMIGGVTMIPFALKYGRRFVYVGSLLVQTGMAVWYGRTFTVGDLMGSNIISCVVGALSEIMVQMTVADIFFVHERGLMNSIYYWIATFGSSLSGIPAGYITQSSLGWRWVWYIMTILLGVLTVLFFFFYEETHYQRNGTVLVHEGVVTASEASAHGNVNNLPGRTLHDDGMTTPEKQSQGDEKTGAHESLRDVDNATPQVQTSSHHYIDYSIPAKPYREKIKLWHPAPGSFLHYCRHSYQCFLVMWHIPSVFYMAVLNGAANTATIICITMYSEYLLDAPYNFNEADIGLMGVAGFVGTALCAPFVGRLSDRMIIWMAKRNGGIYEPEMRLWLILWSAPFFALGQLLFGLALAHKQPWPVVAVGYAIVYFATTPAASLSLTYLTDAYTEVSIHRYYRFTERQERLTSRLDYCRLLGRSRCREIWLCSHTGLRVDTLDQAGRDPEHVYHHHHGLPFPLLWELFAHSLWQEAERAVCPEILRARGTSSHEREVSSLAVVAIGHLSYITLP